MKILHLLAHWLGWNTGTVEAWYERGTLMVGFKCDGCGKISDAHESITAKNK